MPIIQNKLKKNEASFRSSFNGMTREKYMCYPLFTLKNLLTQSHYRTQEMIKKTKVNYNRLMGTLDKTDMVINTIYSQRKNMKWYKKYFFHLINIWNTYCLFHLFDNF